MNRTQPSKSNCSCTVSESINRMLQCFQCLCDLLYFHVSKRDLSLDEAKTLADHFGGPQKLTLQMPTTQASDLRLNSSLSSWNPTGSRILRSRLGTVIRQLLIILTVLKFPFLQHQHQLLV